MSRPLAPKPYSQVMLGLNRQQIEHVNTLIKLGTWGRTAPEVAMRLFDKSLRKVIKKLPK